MKIIIYLLLAIILFIVYVRFLEHTAIFFPSPYLQMTPADVALDYEDVYFKTQDGLKINAWLVKAKPTAPTLLFCHGNAGNISDRLEKIKAFHDLGLNVFIFDYRGYGASEGHPTERGIYLDALGAFDYLQKRDDIDGKKIVAYGVSLGGAPAVDVASKRPIAALILDSTFSSGADMGKVIAPFVPSFLFNVKFDSMQKIESIKVPKLFFHSSQDEMVPFRLGKKLFSVTPEPKSFIELQGLHNDVFIMTQGMYLNHMERFLKKYDLL